MSALLSPADVAQRIGDGTNVRHVKDWTRRYGWPHIVIGRRIFFTEAQVDAIVAKHTVVPKRNEPDMVLTGQTAKSASRSRAR